MRLPIGTIALLAVAILIYFGLAHRVLDRMRLDDRTALAFVVALIVGGLLNITLVRTPVELVVNVGGGLVPLALAIYLLTTADAPGERARGTIAAIVTGAAIYGLAKLLPAEPASMFVDTLYVMGIVAGVVGYIAGRSRRGSFVAGTVGVIIADVLQFIELLIRRQPGRTWIGGAGAFDAVIIAGIIAVVLAEIVGETREKIQGGTDMAGMLMESGSSSGGGASGCQSPCKDPEDSCDSSESVDCGDSEGGERS